MYLHFRLGFTNILFYMYGTLFHPTSWPYLVKSFLITSKTPPSWIFHAFLLKHKKCIVFSMVSIIGWLKSLMKSTHQLHLCLTHCQMTCQMETDENDEICSEGRFYDLNKTKGTLFYERKQFTLSDDLPNGDRRNGQDLLRRTLSWLK